MPIGITPILHIFGDNFSVYIENEFMRDVTPEHFEAIITTVTVLSLDIHILAHLICIKNTGLISKIFENIQCCLSAIIVYSNCNIYCQL